MPAVNGTVQDNLLSSDFQCLSCQLLVKRLCTPVLLQIAAAFVAFVLDGLKTTNQSRHDVYEAAFFLTCGFMRRHFRTFYWIMKLSVPQTWVLLITQLFAGIQIPCVTCDVA